jgi:hypothetical protein
MESSEDPAILSKSARHENDPLRLGAGLILDVNMDDEPDCYIHCTSLEFNSRVMREDFAADSCVMISDAFEFLGRVTCALVEQGHVYPQAVMKPCAYGRCSGPYHLIPNIDRLWLKDRRAYGHQAELRLQWEPLQRPIEPIKVVVPGIGELCTLHCAPGLPEPPSFSSNGAR